MWVRLRTKAEPNGDGSYAITGKKFTSVGPTMILLTTSATWCWRGCRTGLTGTKGISLFMVPKLMPDDDGNGGQA